MSFVELARLSVLNLYRRLSRTALTITGVIIGTACIVMMVSIGLTNTAQFDEVLENEDLRKIEIYSYSGDTSNTLELNESTVQGILSMDEVDYVIPEKTITFYAEARDYYAPYLSITALPTEYLEEIAEIEEGDAINPESNMIQIVMGEGAYNNFIKSEDDYDRYYMGPSLDWLSTEIKLRLGYKNTVENAEYTPSKVYRASVVGILKNTDEDYKTSEIYMSLDMAEEILQENYKLADQLNVSIDGYDTAFVYVNNIDDVSDVLTELRSYGFEAYSNTEWIEELKNQQKTQQGQLLLIGLISLIVSAIGIANTMMTGIIERKKEIGVMKVIGIAISKIRTLFLIESAIIGAAGGLIGCILAHMLSYVIISGGSEISFFGMYFQSGIKFVMPLWLDLGAIGIAIFVGVIAGFFPARKATKMSPLEAIRG